MKMEDNVFDFIRSKQSGDTLGCHICKGLGLIPSKLANGRLEIIYCTNCIKEGGIGIENLFDLIRSKQKQETLDCYICNGLGMVVGKSISDRKLKIVHCMRY
jgi:hypothetical protein